jgi:hypothetical protein
MLTQLADASLDVEAAETALETGAFHTATERLDAADELLAELRASWPSLTAPERAVVGPSAAGIKQRIAAGRLRIPRLSALSLGTPVSDPEEDAPPAD